MINEHSEIKTIIIICQSTVIDFVFSAKALLLKDICNIKKSLKMERIPTTIASMKFRDTDT